MTNYRSLNHSKWACQYHVVFIPKYRKKAIYGELRRYLGEVLRRLARQRESDVEEVELPGFVDTRPQGGVRRCHDATYTPTGCS